MSNLITTTDLQGPTISGAVTVPLAELDKMRLDHANAVKLAKDLESKQMKVCIVYTEIVYRDTINERTGRYETKTEKQEKSREYKNLDEIRGQIAQEEYLKLEKKISECNNENIKLKEEQVDLKKRVEEWKSKFKEGAQAIEDVTKAVNTANKDIADLKKIIEINEEAINISQYNLEIAFNKNKVLEEQIALLKKKHGFWYNLFYYITH